MRARACVRACVRACLTVLTDHRAGEGAVAGPVSAVRGDDGRALRLGRLSGGRQADRADRLAYNTACREGKCDGREAGPLVPASKITRSYGMRSAKNEAMMPSAKLG